jgi:hypothetical protein
MTAQTETPDLSNDIEVSHNDNGPRNTVHIKETYNDGSTRPVILDVEMARFVRDALAVIQNENADVETVVHDDGERKVDGSIGNDDSVWCVLEIHNDGSKSTQRYTATEAEDVLAGLRSEL